LRSFERGLGARIYRAIYLHWQRQQVACRLKRHKRKELHQAGEKPLFRCIGATSGLASSPQHAIVGVFSTVWDPNLAGLAVARATTFAVLQQQMHLSTGWHHVAQLSGIG
jgi:hypothetical protein